MTAQTPSPSDEAASPEAGTPESEPVASTLPDSGATVAAAPRSKEELELEQLSLTNEKLRIETRKLEQDTRPERWWSKTIKNGVAFGGVVAVAATAYGIWDSYDKTIVDRERTRSDREHTRIADQRTRFEDAVKRLESSSTISKLVGVSVLSGYLDQANKALHRQVLFTLAGLMATEKDSQTQAAVVDLMASIPKDGPVEEPDWVYFQDMLITQSRALMAKGDLIHHRQFQLASPLTDDERAARTVGKLIGINVRKGVVPDYRNYRGIYCAKCDFGGVAFPPKVDFTGAVLDDANFSNATLEEGRFDNAELAGVKFVGANLRQALFRSVPESIANGTSNDPNRFIRTAYVDHMASALNENAIVEIRMPNFSCANLQGANFDLHALFPVDIVLRRSFTKSDLSKPGWYRSVPEELKDELQLQSKVDFSPVRIVPPKFFKADITNAKLYGTRVFAFSEINEVPDHIDVPEIIRTADIEVAQGGMRNDAFRIESSGGTTTGGKDSQKSRAASERDDFQLRMRATFYSVELDQALLPANLMNFLRGSKPTLAEYSTAFRRSIPLQSPDLDLNCLLPP